MKIAFVCPYDLSRPGGVQRHLLDLAAQLQNRGDQVAVIAPKMATDISLDLPLVLIGRRRSIRINQGESDITLLQGDERRELEDYLEKEAFDLLHFHTIWEPFLPLQVFWASLKLRRRKRIRTRHVATFHETPPNTLLGWFLRRFYKLLSWVLYHGLDGVIAVSDSAAAHLYQHPRMPVRNLSTCADFQPFIDHSSKHAVVAANTSDKQVRILFVGRMDERKGVLILLRAYHLLVQEGLPVTLTLAGDGVQADRAKALIKALDLPDVTLLGRFEEWEKPAIYAASDLCCSPAPFGESFGLILTEAMASGKPVVAAANEGYRRVLAAKADETLCRPGDVKDLHNKLKRLVLNPELRHSLGVWGRQEAQRYDCRNYLSKVIPVYRAALRQQPDHLKPEPATERNCGQTAVANSDRNDSKAGRGSPPTSSSETSSATVHDHKTRSRPGS
ncbi:MAG: glycosyltransferase family 4 protein [Magnetococcales bacterium]|nr:glycosyltransferase family 4 protein [Magnetococcales bacterium]